MVAISRFSGIQDKNLTLILDGIFETDDEGVKGSKIRNEIPKEFASVRTITGK